MPITGQTLAVLLVGGALGLRRGLLSVVLYLVIGLALPVYAGGGSGIDTFLSRGRRRSIVFGATGGYLIGFLLAAAVVGRLAELGWDRHSSAPSPRCSSAMSSSTSSASRGWPRPGDVALGAMEPRALG